MNLGVCYYPEHWAPDRAAIDAKWMREAGLTLVRMGEFAWSRLEPRPGEFELEWLDRAIEIFAAENFTIVLGTPTGAPPPWLSRTYPETLPVDEWGRRRDVGARKHYCPNSAVFHAYARRIVFAVAARYAQDARVGGWQIDNEFGEGSTARCYCDACAAAFRAWLVKKYARLDALNDAWGSVFWSQEYTDWSQINPPVLHGGHEPNPSHALDYNRFCSDSFVAFQQMQADTIRRAHSASAPTPDPRAHPQFITHNFMGLYPDLDQHALAETLDFVAWDSYPTGHAERWQALREDADDGVYAYDVGNPYLTGLAHAVVRGLKSGAPYWIMEQQAGQINWGAYNPSPRPDVVGLWLWHNFAAGAGATLFFRERATWFAQEQYHSGLLNHDGSPAQGYADLVAFREQHALMRSLQDTRVENEVALLISYEDLWAIQSQPHRKDFSYWNVVFTWYAALARAGVPCDVISKRADLSNYKLVIAPCLHLADEGLAARLTRYTAGGGLLVLGVRSGFKTPTNKVTGDPLPGVLRELVGATVSSWQSLPPGVVRPTALMWRGWQRVNATRWIETLEPASAGTIACYVGNHLDGRAAMTVNAIGAGRAMYCGWLPDQAQADALVGMLLPEAGVEPLALLPQGVIAGRRARASEMFLTLMNFTDAGQRAWVNGTGWRDAATGHAADGEVSIAPREVRLLARNTQASSSR